ncbi:MAG: ABC transporter permease [Lachnospiraceae bacterium]|nr:ABC transporter permease [Lachnospiraceae bacterium]
MRSFWAINKRNTGLYFRDFSAVFFSLLSMIIIILLMVFFLGDVNSSELTSAISMVPGRGNAKDLEYINHFSFLWVCAGILTINASTVTHAFFSNMIKDRSTGRLNSMLVMPVKRSVFVLGFVFSSWLTGVIMSLVTFAIMEIIGVIRGMQMLPLTTHLWLVLLILINNMVYSTIMFLLASIVKSQSAWSGIGILLGTLSGFLGGIYFPFGSMSAAMQKFVMCFPFIYGTSLFRKFMLMPLEADLFEGTPDIIRQEVDRAMGMDLFVGTNQLSETVKICILLFVGVLFILLSTLHITLSKKKDR